MTNITYELNESKLELFMKIRDAYDREKENKRILFVNNNFEMVDQQFGNKYRYFLEKLVLINKLGILRSKISSRTILMHDHDAINELNFNMFLIEFSLKNENVIIAERNYMMLKRKKITEMNNKMNLKMKNLLYCLNKSKNNHSDNMRMSIEVVSLHLHNCILEL
jgi:hypothetical protein